MRIRNVCVVTLSCILYLASMGMASEKASYGLKLGVNFATIEGDVDVYVRSQSHRACVSFGGFATMRQIGNLYLQPEVLYAEKGAKGTLYNGADITGSLVYLEIPFLAKYRIRAGNEIGFGIYAGPAADFLLSANFQSRDVKDFVSKLDGAIVIGGSVDIPAGKGLLTLEGRYLHGLNYIDDDKAYNVNVRNRVVSIMLGYSFTR